MTPHSHIHIFHVVYIANLNDKIVKYSRHELFKKTNLNKIINQVLKEFGFSSGVGQ